MKDDTKDNDYDSKKVAAGNNSGHGGSALMDLEDKVLLATYQRIMSDPGSASGGSSEDKQQKEAQRETQIQAPVRDMQESLRVSSPVDLSVARFSPDDKDNQEGLARAQLEPAVRDGSVKLCHSSSTSVCLQNDEAKQMIDRFYANMGDIDSKGLSRYSGVNPTPVSQFKKSVADHDMKGEKTGTDEQIIRHLDAIMDDIEAKDLAQGTTSPTTSQVKNMVAEEQIARRLDATMGDVEAKRVTRYRGMDPSQTTLLSFLDPVSDEAKQKLDNNIAGNGDEVECNSRHSGKHVMSSSSSFGTGSQAGATVESITTAVSEEHNSHAVLTHGSNLPTQQDEENSFVPGASIQIVLGPGAHAVMTPLPADSGGSTVTVTNEQDADIEQDVDIEQLSNQSDTDNNKGLAIANFVVEEDRDIPLAEAVTGRLQVSTSTKTRYYLIVASICCFVFGGLAVLLLVVFFLSSASQDEKDATINGAPTVPSQNASKISPLAKEEYVLSLLPSHTSDQIKKRPEGPQALALKWLLQNDTVLLGDMEDGVLRSPWRYLQRFSLMTFYYSTEGPRWFNSTGWGTSADECNWHQFDIYQSIEYGDLLFENPDDIALLQLWNISGWDIDHDDFLHSHENQSACNANGEYQHLSLYSNNLRGSIPEELYMLTSLKSLYLFANELHGTISARIGDLRKLEAVRLTGNAVAGSLPTEIGLLSSTFQRASLNSLQLTGTIPTEIVSKSIFVRPFVFRMTFLLCFCSSSYSNSRTYSKGVAEKFAKPVSVQHKLRSLNSFCMRSLFSYYPMSSITARYLEINHLTGELPTTLGLMENLKLFYVFSNELTGFLPTELGKLAKMKDFQMYVNSMSGTIPTEIGSMANLIRLYIDELGLSGTIPTEIGKLTLMKDM